MENDDSYYNFYGCYLLTSTNPKYKGWTYIGFTVDPNKRIKQHNGGRRFGGAKRTSGKGPWIMVLVVHGFPNEIVALQFEWAWQNPKNGRRLRHLSGKKASESGLEFRFRILTEMLRCQPWCSLPLIIRWLEPQYEIQFPVSQQAPQHMPIAYGPIKIGNFKHYQTDDRYQLPKRCVLCHCRIEGLDELLVCTWRNCQMSSHLTCLAEQFANDNGMIVPIQGNCPVCSADLLWGDLITQFKLATKSKLKRRRKERKNADDDNSSTDRMDLI
ncbi:Structure-specific endonuclease subunit SLX1-like protein [Trichoplax sp. H2]|nr:Structure-specific endonuclease subunit SLX1-like protein [Trichoplax sp. H2]|eukprot:RDD37819.1 Structure-specific endonuclease subunit SLX1-like protein [Trichoplax sp. H2]